MSVQTYVTSRTAVTRLLVTDGLENIVAGAWRLSVVRPPYSDQWIIVGLGNRKPIEAQLTAHVQSTSASGAAAALDELRQVAEAAAYLYVESEGAAFVTGLAAFLGVSGVTARGPHSYSVTLRWIPDTPRIAGYMTDAGGAILTSDDGGTTILWEEEI